MIKNKRMEILNKLNILKSVTKRRNVYINANYKNVLVRICVGDNVAKCVLNRKPTFLNVAIIHRSGIVCGSWYENDKLIYNPLNDNNMVLKLSKE
ncbi:MAG: hypothetical protein IJ572_00030 [Bacilli bacterium]|nr:hypothetical protein [Bacilli bacterium]